MRRAIRSILLMLATAGLLGLSQPAFAQFGGSLRDINVEGNQRIEADTVRSYMLIAPGDPFDDEKIDRSLKALFATGLFADVTASRQGNNLMVRVVENPIINRLAFEGNQRLTEEVLLKEVQLRPRQVYSRSKVQSDLQRILQLYRRSGRFAATVEPKVIQLPQNRVDLVFEITEGAATRIERIRFIGNGKYSDGRLREVLSTKETAWWRFLSNDDTYDPDRVNYDREQLRKFYLSHGYADFRVVSAVAELTPSREAFFITFTVEEGDAYKFGTVDVKSSIPGLTDTAAFKPAVTLDPGDTFDAGELDRTIQNITARLGELGYAFVDVKPDVRKNRDTRIIDVTFQIDEGPRVYVERINVTGNVRTLDKVIRREFRLSEGDAYNRAKLDRSRTRLRGLAFFEKVNIAETRGSEADKIVLDVNVQDKSTGELTVGAGFSTSEAILGNIGLRERNFLGRGQDVKLNLSVSKSRQQIDHSFTEPYFLDRELLAGYDVFHTKYDFQNRSNYDQTSTGGGLRLGFPVTEHLFANPAYRIRRDIIDNVKPGASAAVIRQQGSSVTSTVGYTLVYDRLDDRSNPSDGYLVKFGEEYGGVGGTEYFVRHTGSYAHYFPIFDQVVLSGALEGGHIFGLSDDVRLTNRFYVGGDNFRGFKAGGVGARDATSGDALGANIYYTATAEAQFPLGLPQEFGMLGRVFGLVGSAHDVDEPAIGLLESSALRATVGVGLSWRSPLGPIKLDFSLPVMKQDFDQTEYFRFNFGTRF